MRFFHGVANAVAALLVLGVVIYCCANSWSKGLIE